MRVKSVFDPAWLLKPGQGLPLDGRPILAAEPQTADARDQSHPANAGITR